jgi:hypothetical protein
LYSSPTIIRIVDEAEMGEACNKDGGGDRNACKLLIEKPEGKRPLAMNQTKMCSECDARKVSSGYKTGGLSSYAQLHIVC